VAKQQVVPLAGFVIALLQKDCQRLKLKAIKPLGISMLEKAIAKKQRYWQEFLKEMAITGILIGMNF
jgi:hypothetical protein